MAKLDNVKRIKPEDFPKENQQLVEILSSIYNFFAEQVTNTLDGNIDFDNLTRDITELTVTVGSTGVPTTPTRFTAKTGLRGISIINISNLSNTRSLPTVAPYLAFSSQGTGTYTVEKVIGLEVNSRYKLVVELIF